MMINQIAALFSVWNKLACVGKKLLIMVEYRCPLFETTHPQLTGIRSCCSVCRVFQIFTLKGFKPANWQQRQQVDAVAVFETFSKL